MNTQTYAVPIKGRKLSVPSIIKTKLGCVCTVLRYILFRSIGDNIPPRLVTLASNA